MSSFTWLHLSDLHFTAEPEPQQRAAENALLKDIEGLAMEGGLRANLVFVTGDIAFSGNEKEYCVARSFLDRLLRATGISKEFLFLVPGNHDVNRLNVGVASHLASAMSDSEVVSKLVMDAHARDLFLRRQAEYRQFVEAYFGPDHQKMINDLFYVQRIEVGGLDVAVIGLNSAWTSAKDQEYGQLVLGEWQVREGFEKAEGADLIICLVHHPFEWLRGFERDDVIGLIERYCDVVVRGHLHKTRLETRQTPMGHLCTLAAGSSFAGWRYPNSYNVVAVDAEAATACAHLRLWVGKSGGWWTWDNQAGPLVGYTGQYQFDLPRLRTRQLSRPTSYRFSSGLGECLKALDADLIRQWQSDLPDLPHEYVPTSVSLAGDTYATTELMRHRRTVVLGPPGSGKTSAAIHVARTLIDLAIRNSDLQLPLYIDLARPTADKSVLEMIEEQAVLTYRLNSRLEAKHHLQAGHFTLLLDSADELPPQEFGLRMAEILALSRSSTAERSAYMLFCRDFVGASFFRKWAEFSVLNLAPMSQPEMEALAHSLGLVALPDHGDVLEFCRFPFYLCLYACLQGKIQQRQRGKLLERFIVETVRRRAESWLRPDDLPVFLEVLLATFAQIAEKSQYGSPLSSASVADMVATTAPYQEQVQHALVNSGILDFIHGEYRFRSRIVHDYFLARALVSQPERWQFCLQDSRLQDVAFILVDLLPSRRRGHLVRAALEVIAGGSIPTLLNYNLASLETTPERLIRAVGRVSAEDVMRLLRDPDVSPVAAFRLVNVLASIGGRAITDYIRSLLQDRTRHIYLRVGAVLAASQLEPDSCAQILQVLENDHTESPLLRLESSRTLARLKKHPEPSVASLHTFQYPLPCSGLSETAVPVQIGQMEALVRERIGTLRHGATPHGLWLAERMTRVFFEREGVITPLAASMLSEQWDNERPEIIDLIWWLVETISRSPFAFYLDRAVLESEKPHISTSIYFEPILDVPTALSRLDTAEALVILNGYQTAAAGVTEDQNALVAKLAYLDLLRQWTLPVDLRMGFSGSLPPTGADVSVEVARRRVVLMNTWSHLVADRWLDDKPELLHLCHELGFSTEGTVFQQVAFQPNSAGHCLFARIHYALDAIRNADGYESARRVTVKLADALAVHADRVQIAADSLYYGVIRESPAILQGLIGQARMSHTLVEGVHGELMDMHVRLQEELLRDWHI